MQGARANNLKDVSVEIPKRRLTVFTGVSGSGKSSLVFGTIAAESQRLINETYSAFVQGFMPSLARPEVDRARGPDHGDHRRPGADGRQPALHRRHRHRRQRDAADPLQPARRRRYVGPPTAFSFNVPTRKASGVMSTDKGGRVEKSVVKDAVYLGGMCPRCEGMGNVSDIDLTALYDETKSLSDGALTIPGYSMDGWYGRLFEGVGLPMDKPIASFTKKQLDTMLYAEPTKIKVEGINLTFDGIIPKIQKSMLSKDPEAMQPHVRRFVERAVTFQSCPECDGTRLTQEALSSRIDGKNIAELCAMQISDLADWVRDLDEPSVAPLLAGLQHLLDSFTEIGLGYLSLDRPAGHAVRGRGPAHQDDPAPRVVADRRHLRLRRAHDRPAPPRHRADERPAAAAARQGQHRAGRRAQAGDHRDRRPRRRPRARAPAPAAAPSASRATSTGCGRATPPPAGTSTTGPRSRRRCAPPSGALEVRGAATHNLQDVDVDVPLGVLCVVTGVAGSGKSSLIHGSVAGRDGVVVVDQGAIKGSRRSNPATYTGLLEPIRKAFAKANGVKPALFSSNSEGACPTCNGAGVIFTELGVMATVESPCEECEGRRFQASVLEYTLGGREHRRGAGDVGDRGRGRSSPTARRRTPAAHKILDRLADVGLGYLSLGQPLTTLSGGERQRLKLATQMAEKGDVYVLDEPTTGLHLADVEQPARAAGPAGRLRQVGHRHRAPPGGDGARRLDHRPRPGRRPRRRPASSSRARRPTSSPPARR